MSWLENSCPDAAMLAHEDPSALAAFLICGCASHVLRLDGVAATRTYLGRTLAAFGEHRLDTASNGPVCASELGAVTNSASQASSGVVLCAFDDVRDAARAATGLVRLPRLKYVSVSAIPIPETVLEILLPLGSPVSRELLFFELSRFGTVLNLVYEGTGPGFSAHNIAPEPGQVVAPYFDNPPAPAAGPRALCLFADSRHAAAAAEVPLFACGVAFKVSVAQVAHAKVCPALRSCHLLPWQTSMTLFSPTYSELVQAPARARAPWGGSIRDIVSSAETFTNSDGASTAALPQRGRPYGPLYAGGDAGLPMGPVLPLADTFKPPLPPAHYASAPLSAVPGFNAAGKVPHWLDASGAIGGSSLPSPPPESGSLPVVPPPLGQWPLPPPPRHAVPVTPLTTPFSTPEGSERHGPVRGAARADNAIDIARLESGEEMRATVMLRNIPNKLDVDALKAFLDETNEYTYDFLYLRMDFANRCNVGYAFVSFTEPRHLATFARARLGAKWPNHNSAKEIALAFGTIQGTPRLIRKFSTASVMSMDEEFRPKLFYTTGPDRGKERPFPLIRVGSTSSTTA